MASDLSAIHVRGASEHNLKDLDVVIPHHAITVITGVSGSGKSTLAFDTILAEAQRRFFHTLSHYSRQFLDIGARPKVRHVSGLSPPIGLRQNETQPSRRATVGSLTDIIELLGVLMARFGVKTCPKHKKSTASQSAEEIVQRILMEHDGKFIAIGAPIVQEKKGAFSQQLHKALAKGFTSAIIDGVLQTLSPELSLAKESKHTITVIVDFVKVKAEGEARLLRSVQSALAEANGFGVYFLATTDGAIQTESAQIFSTAQGCPVCGFSWPRLDSRHFSPNSLGRCPSCQGYGLMAHDESEDTTADDVGSRLRQASAICTPCSGTGILGQMAAISFGGRSIQDILSAPLKDAAEAAEGSWRLAARENPALERVIDELHERLARLVEVGLGYLSLARRVTSLSGGEAQRMRIAGILSGQLRNILYVLDEPSQGLHPTEVDQLCHALARLKARGNTIILVDHDEGVMRHADWIIDLGPGGGHRGGELMAKFRPAEAAHFCSQSRTAEHLARGSTLSLELKEKVGIGATAITILAPRLYNLKMPAVRFPRGALSVVAGVSGAGKSSLVLSVLYENVGAFLANPGSAPRFCQEISGIQDLTRCELVDRRPVAKSSASMPATYLDVLGELRQLYGKLPAAQIAGLSPKSFSLAAAGGRCEVCKGRGEISLEMRFLADARIQCHACGGRRYQTNVESVLYNGRSIADILELTIEELLVEFRTFKKIVARLKPAVELGLGYLRFGQPSASLSGGESQRLKLASLFNQKLDAGTLVIMDEPTTGLHFDDVARLIKSLSELTERGVTVVLIEHNEAVIRAADWVVNIGPGAADEGGQLLSEGPPTLSGRYTERL